ncbi:hypothetical protein HNQ07_003709 [Deinococcus metalli]|uniref:Uncharacterized protein n=1 Tax=Deinococcus metalli TaxID=1141878 RepID=A0A7W8KI53_9DEIO|nr:hypothetical protein [Deinococcus metalli]MBB5378208.1 hypothetical protein [Deinococcus metalli]GHF56835.1 hypothetical protein GCM10017781_36470 [Deinococcus metalli]
MREFHALLREWETFYLLLGTAGATLAGLMFIAVTVGERLTRRTRMPLLRAHLDPALLALLLTLILSATLLMPSLTRFWFGTVLVGSGAGGVIYMLAVQRALPPPKRRRWDGPDWMWYAVAPLLSSGLLIAAGALAFTGQSRAALTTAALTLILLLLMGVRNAWDLVTFSIMMDSPEPGHDATPRDPPPA